MTRRLLAALLLLGLAACAGAPRKEPAPAAPATSPATAAKPARKVSPYAPAQEDPNTRGHYTAGGLYRPGVPDSTPDYVPDVDLIPEPEVTAEPRSRVGNRASYSVLGKQYHLLENPEGYLEEGRASYYGSKFHGRRTSNLEVYDMNAFTAAHKTLPLPSFARVTNLQNGKSVVVRVNDRGPFHEGRLIDLSYAAAVKIGVYPSGTGQVEVRALTPGAGAGVGAGEAVAAAAPKRSSTLDNLVSTLPTTGNAALKLPPGVRIATGKPTRLDGRQVQGSAPLTSPGTPQSPHQGTGEASMDGAGVPAPEVPDWRFDMKQNGRTMTADEFDHWMAARRVNVATGMPAPRPNLAVPLPDGNDVDVAQPSPSARSFDDAVTLQVASFSGRGNADRALAMLQGAGIAVAALHTANANGLQVWRLRVGPVPPEDVAPLSTQIAKLGFGPPQRVRD
ncbi:MAG: septal ring lytic transglycosylase RlpA family protein [Pseudomonadota bacterium]|nr:septal ring lytic transglycosylase RlpA family protein [Pseudomonadota bacterium]